MAKINSNALAIKHLLIHLATGSHSVFKLSELTGLRRLTIYDWFKLWRKKPNNIIYVSHWSKGVNRGHCTAHYSLGYKMDDEPRPPRQDKITKNKKLRERNKAYKERMKARNEQASK